MAESKIAELYNIPIPEFIFFSALQTFGKPHRFSVQNAFFPQQISAHDALLPCGQQTRAMGFFISPLNDKIRKSSPNAAHARGGNDSEKKFPMAHSAFRRFDGQMPSERLLKLYRIISKL